MRYLIPLLLCALFALPAGLAKAGARPPSPQIIERSGPKPTWLARKRSKAKKFRPTGAGLIDMSQWPPEPATPEAIDPVRFAKAIEMACGWMPPHRPTLYAELILRWSATFEIDPMLLAGLMVSQSHCRPRSVTAYGSGLTQIHQWMHLGHIKDRVYHYSVREGDAWVARTLPIKEFLFYGPALRQAESNLYFAAAFLRVFKDQSPALASAFGSIEHRHYVSHFVWGDRVRGRGHEDRILTERRRLIQYYEGRRGEAAGDFRGLPIQSPLDGTPRIITSDMGDPRDGGKRRHKGVDFGGPRGEAVHAIADGTVNFAGVDLKRGPSARLGPKAAKQYPTDKMGAGGLLLALKHDQGLSSHYMHLDDYTVVSGQVVKRGDLIGHVGRSGIRESSAHLHFELRHDNVRIDPVPVFGPLIFPPVATFKGYRLDWEEHRKRRKKRRAKR
jgi:murein DD-endopeptidase MepM/ murein hydrolase activator NlpD